MKLIVIIPAFNEEATIARVVTGSLRPIDGIDDIEVLVINDASTDNTAHVAEEAGATVIQIERRVGLGYVFGVGLQQARQRCADIMVNIDGDGQFDSRDIPKLIKPVLEDHADFVTCTRFGPGIDRPHMPWVKYWGNQMVVGLVNWICGYGARFTDVSCGFRAFNREAMYRLTLFGKFTYTQEVFLDLFRKNLRMMEVPLIVQGQRSFGKSRVASNVFRYGVHSGMIMLRAVRDIKPLKFFGSLSSAIFVISAMIGLWMVTWYIWSGKTSPYTSLITVGGVLLLLSFVLLIVGLLADMISRHRHITEELLYLARRRLYTRAKYSNTDLSNHSRDNLLRSPKRRDLSVVIPDARESQHSAKMPVPNLSMDPIDELS